MYAVIRTGGKQYRVEPGQKLAVGRLEAQPGDTVDLAPVLFVDGDTVLATPSQLAGATVTARVVDDAKGPKIHGFTYKNKSNQRKRWGHRQRLSLLEITTVAGGSKPAAKSTAAKKAPAKAAATKKTTASKTTASKTAAPKTAATKPE